MGNKLEGLLDVMRAEGNGQISAPTKEFLDALKESEVIMPAIMPPNTDPKILRQMMQYSGKNMGVPQGANPQPCVFENGNGKKFLPVFTSEEEMKKAPNGQKFPISMTLPFDSCMKLLKQTGEITGIVVNAFSHNIIFTPKSVEEEKKNVQVTLEQFHHLTRQRMESSHLPLSLYKKKEELVSQLRTRQGECMKELYDEIYDTEIACPYEAEDFEFITLQITDDMQVIQISMPKKHVYPMTCTSAIIVWNKKTEEIGYYTILLGKQPGDERHIMQVTQDGTPKDLGSAPAEGNELSYVIDLVQKN